jgi:hypothetical protein
MKRAWERREAVIAREIRKVSHAVAQPAPGRWEFLLSNGSPFGVSGILDAEWLILETPLVEVPRVPSPAELLRANASLPGLAKFSEPGRGRISIEAEIPTTVGVPLAARLEETLHGFSRAHAIASGKPARSPAARAEDSVEHDPESRRRITETMRRTPWIFRERDDGSLAVELESDCGYHLARVAVGVHSGGVHSGGAGDDGAGDDSPGEAPVDGQGFEVTVTLADWRSPSADSREAAARMLLAANHGMRMGRASITEAGDRWTAHVEIRLGSIPGDTELRHVLAALAVACRQWARELQSLQQESTARAYLAVRSVR